MTEATRFRILALDGGGVKGTYTAAVLATIEQASEKRIVDHFDLIAGTSTGGILALGLGLGLSATEMLEFYVNEGPRIFPSSGVVAGLGRRLRQLVRAKHSAAPLHQTLETIFQDKRLGDSTCRLVIPSYNPAAGDIHVFKTAHDDRVLQDHTRRAVEVARATSAAPTFLPLFKATWGQSFLDGGLWANCPSTIAVLEAVAVLGHPIASIHVLSIGTTEDAFSPGWRAAWGGALTYGTSVVKLLMQAQAKAGWAQTRLLVRDRAMRIDHRAPSGFFLLDDARRIPALRDTGEHDGRHHAQRVIATFMDTPVATFVPIKR